MTYRRVVQDAVPKGAVSRREFLSMHTRGSQRVLELACEPLYMRYVDAQSQIAARDRAETVNHTDFGEPVTAFAQPTPQDLVVELECHLADTDVLRVTGESWLSGNGLARQVKACLENFRARGGLVEYSG